MAWTERYVRADADGSGDGTTDSNTGASGSWTLSQAISNANAGHRINVKAGTYSNGATNLTFANGAGAATTTAPKWWRGYKTTIGDMDGNTSAVKATDIPSIEWTTGFFNPTGTHQTFSNLHLEGARSTGQCFLTGTFNKFENCRFVNTNASSGALAVQAQSANGTQFSRCLFSATSSATFVVDINDDAAFTRCRIVGGGIGIDVAANAVVRVVGCVFATGTTGVNCSGNVFVLDIASSVFYGMTGDGITITTTLSSESIVSGCLFSECGGYGINNSSGTNANTLSRISNAFYIPTSGEENGFGDTPALNSITLTADPFVDAAAGDFNINNTAGGGALLRATTVVLP